jgi:hypothetical protein
MIAENGMSVITVKKDELLETLRKNRETHAGEYKEARAGYEKEFIAELKKHLALAESGKDFIMVVTLSIPEDHTGDYDKVIRMLEWSVNDTVFVTEREFSQYVLDEWNWTHHTKAVNSAYVVGRTNR